MMKLPVPDVRAERRLAIGLALVAGYVDTYALLAFGTYVSFMSGNTTQTGAATGQGKFVAALPSALAIVCFVAGCFAGTWLMHSSLRRTRRLLFGVVAALVAVIALTPMPSRLEEAGMALGAEAAIATLSMAMGMMNATLSRVGAEPVNLTFVTGTLNKIGRHLALAVRKAPLPDAQGPWDTHLVRAGVMASIWAGFLTGGVLSGAASTHFGARALLAPLLILLALAVFSGADRA